MAEHLLGLPTKHKPKDIKPQGAGSTLDADLLDGLHASEIGGGGPHASTHETGGIDEVHFAELEHSLIDATLHDALTSTPHISQADKDKIHLRIPHIFRTGRFYFPSRITVGWGADPSIAFPTGFAYAYPMYLPNSKTFNLLRCEVTAVVAGAAAKFALYANNNGVPGSLIATLGEVSCGTAGLKDIAINVTVEELVFWVFTVSSGSVGFRAIDSGYGFDYYGSTDITYRGANCFRGNQYYLDPFYDPFSLNVPSSWQIPFCVRAA